MTTTDCEHCEGHGHLDGERCPACESLGVVPAAPAPPTPLLEGAFAIYRTPDGGVVLVWRKKGEEKNRPLPVPAFILNMAAAQGGVNVDELIAKITAGDVG